MKIRPSEPCTDAEFLRRVYLDLTGLPPTAEVVRAFLADASDSRAKRDAVVDKLIGSPEFVDYWTNKWADLLQVNRKFLEVEGAGRLPQLDPRARSPRTRPTTSSSAKILTASGSNKENPAAAYYKILREPTATMENTTQLFLAVRFNCNKCHDHPFERWTQDQYYQTSAYFAQVDLKADPASGGRQIGGTAVESGKPLYEVVSDAGKGEVKHDRTGEFAAPKFPFPSPHKVARGRDTPAGAGGVDHLGREPVLRQELRQPALGLPARRRDHRADRRHPRGQPGDEPRAARLPDRGVHQVRVQRPAPDAADLQVADVPALGRHEQVERGRQGQLLARDRPPAAGGGPARQRLPGDRLVVEVPGRAAGDAGRRLARLGRRAAERVPRRPSAAPSARAPASASAPAASSSARSWPW